LRSGDWPGHSSKLNSLSWSRQWFSTPQLSSVGDGVAHWSHFLLFLADRSGTRSDPLHPWQGSTGCVSRDAVLHTTVELLCYLSLCVPPCMILAVFLRPLINEPFSFLHEKPSMRYWNQHAWHQISYHSPSSFIPF
jgi:hypothetical protein